MFGVRHRHHLALNVLLRPEIILPLVVHCILLLLLELFVSLRTNMKPSIKIQAPTQTRRHISYYSMLHKPLPSTLRFFSKWRNKKESFNNFYTFL